MLLPRKLYAEAAQCITRRGTLLKTPRLCRELSEYGVKYFWATNGYGSQKRLEGDGWFAIETFGGVIELYGERAHEARGELEALVMLVHLSE